MSKSEDPAALAAAVALMLPFAKQPKPWATMVDSWVRMNDASFPGDEDAIASDLESETSRGALRASFRNTLALWDHVPKQDAKWCASTPPHSQDRRERIYDLLEIQPRLRDALEKAVPPYLETRRAVAIEHGGYEHWYTEARRMESNFYWQSYRDHLETVRGWDPDDILSIDDATSEVIERLADPRRGVPRQVKGLVVGYVQSGKTANFAGVTSKASDAGYRLIIVMSGNTNLLRNQTQRRIDQDILGQEIIRPGGDDDTDETNDYIGDKEWDKFARHGGQPHELGTFDWTRLTGEVWDYKRLRANIESLSFVKSNTSKPFYAAENLERSPARILVIKKHAGRIKNVIDDLKKISHKANLAEVPVLIIDDESDQASVNTAKPRLTKKERQKRTKINERIVELIALLPRAQYIGYTATPFANVLIDPNDPEDLFPRDFIVSLPRPPKYLGPSDFHDLDGTVFDEENRFSSNETCFVRSVEGSDSEAKNLPQAIDSYILAGAVKLWRADQGTGAHLEHHTMLIHSSPRVAEHDKLSTLVQKLFAKNGYDDPSSYQRLEDLWVTDTRPVIEARGANYGIPDWSALKQYIGKCVQLVRGGDGPVIQVNGTEQAKDPNFAKQSVWAILVGGAKLSRGYTVEGLTTSYFRRRAGTGDTLMQMGRWFGYRIGYDDLVRLYVGTAEPLGKKTVNLYGAFEAVCRDEEEFRTQLESYALTEPGTEPLRPIEVPPFISSHLEWLPPVAKNKRQNAVLEFNNLGGECKEPTLAPIDEARIVNNEKLFRKVLEDPTVTFDARQMGTEARVDVLYAAVETRLVEEIVRNYKWSDGKNNSFKQSVISFLQGKGDRDPKIDDWILIAPQLKSASRVPAWKAAGQDFQVKQRSRTGADEGRVKVYSEPAHRTLAEWLAGIKSAPSGAGIDDLVSPHQGVILFYPVHHFSKDEEPSADFVPTMGFALQFPHNSIKKKFQFTVHSEGGAGFVDK